MMAVDAVSELKKSILLAIEQLTWHTYPSIEAFNDQPATTHDLVLKVLRQARANILMDSPTVTKQPVGTFWARLVQFVR